MSERNYLIDDVREALDQILSDRTPVASNADSLAKHELNCSWARSLGKRLNEMEKTQIAHGELLAEFVGAQKLQRWMVPIITGVLSSSVAAAFVAWMLRHG
jgi:hypothetical protein